MRNSSTADIDESLGGRDWVAYATPFALTDGSAGSRRILGVAMSILESGRDVVVLSGGESAGVRLVDTSSTGARLWLVGAPDLTPEATRFGRQMALHVSAGRSAMRWLSARQAKPSHIIVYGGGASYALRARRLARSRDLALIADVVEWYAPRQFRGGVLSPSYLTTHLALRRLYPQFDGVVAISEYLRAHFAASGVRAVVIVPPTLDVEAVSVRAAPRKGNRAIEGRTSPLVLCYFGTPGRKDLLAEMIDGVSEVRRRGAAADSVVLRVAGPTESEISAALGGGVIPPGVEAVGRLSASEVGEFVRTADLSLLLRPDETYSRAGFPTKFVESLSYGTPVVANLTSDLSQYLVDGHNGFVVAEPTAAGLHEVIIKAMRNVTAVRTTMRMAAHSTAITSFDFRRHVQALDHFLAGTAR